MTGTHSEVKTKGAILAILPSGSQEDCRLPTQYPERTILNTGFGPAVHSSSLTGIPRRHSPSTFTKTVTGRVAYFQESHARLDSPNLNKVQITLLNVKDTYCKAKLQQRNHDPGNINETLGKCASVVSPPPPPCPF